MGSPDSILTGLLLEAANAVALQLGEADQVLHVSNPDLFGQWLARSRAVDAGERVADLLQSLFTDSQIAQLHGALPAQTRLLPAKASRLSRPRWFELTRVQMPADSGCTSLLLIVERTAQQNLANALAEARVAQDLAHTVLRTDPAALRQFLHNATSALGFIRTTLRQPSRTHEALCAKLRLLRNEAQSLCTWAAALVLQPVGQSARAMVEALDGLLALADASGDDMLPLALHIDAMSIAITTLAELDEQRAVPTPVGRTSAREASVWHAACEQRINELIARVGSECGVLARLRVKGGARVPQPYQRRIDAAIEGLIDNALRHGIETPEERINAGKPATGTITVVFRDLGATGFEMTVHDDGRGVDLDRMRQIATGQDLAPRELVGLIFRAGELGPGRSMALLREGLRRHGGNVSVATKSAHYTRFHVQFAAVERLPAQRMAALTR